MNGPAAGRSGTAVRLALLLVLLGAFALRLLDLAAQSLWWDEGISMHLATSTLPALMADRLANIHPPLYFVLLKGWLALTGVSVFSARYLSVLASWLQVAALYAVARRDLGRRAAWLAAFLGAISAVSVIYAQETRVYAFLPLLYLALLGVTRRLIGNAPDSRPRAALWLLLAALSWTALHLHYIAVFAVGTVFGWALLVFARERRWADLRGLFLSGLLLLLISLPWFAAALANWTAVQSEANAGTFITEATPWPFLLGQVWAFHLTGLAGALGRPFLAALVAGTAVLLALLALWWLANAATRRKTAVLLALWLVPLGSALVVWQVRSFSHPRYVAMFVPALLLLCAYLVLPGRTRARGVTAVLGGLLLAGLIASSLVGLWLYFTDPQVAKDDVRGAARYLEAGARPGDLILVPDTDWSLPFEYDGLAGVAMPGWEEAGGGWARLAELTAGAPRVFTLDYERGTRDWQERLPFALHAAGTLQSEQAFPGVIVRAYELRRPVTAPVLAPTTADFGSLRLTGMAWPEDAAAGAATAVALQWQITDPAALARTQVALRLLDQDGRPLATADDLLLDEYGRPTGQWLSGQAVTTYHLLDIPPGVPPLAYDLGIQLYELGDEELRVLEVLDDQGAPQGQEAILTGLPLRRGDYPPTSGSAPLPLLPAPVPLAEGLVLLGFAGPGAELAAGQAAGVELLWQGEGDLADLRPALALVQEGRELALAADAPANGRYPTTQWAPDEWVWERRALQPPPGVSGAAELRLRLGDEDILLGEVVLGGGERLFTAPAGFAPADADFAGVARLAGYNLPRTLIASNETLPVRLLWQPLSGGAGTDYAVFVHLLDADGRIIAQHDGVPAEGARPTGGWLPGEFIADGHELVFRERGYSGPARLVVGLYDPRSGKRVTLADGRDSFELPASLQVTPP